MDEKKYEDLVRKMDVMLYGFDISNLSVKEQKVVEEQATRRRELEEMKERLNPKPKPKLSKSEQLEVRRLEALEAKFEKIANGRPVKELSNNDLEKQLKVMRAMVK
ncbi:hypothetical protein ABES23_06140 [Peribacillus frigoritolerans]|uniref:hypothetical protein n=1 Tax=Peribacillus frigoritolerans TaxID=450367 RepID=UPI003D28529B